MPPSQRTLNSCLGTWREHGHTSWLLRAAPVAILLLGFAGTLLACGLLLQAERRITCERFQAEAEQRFNLIEQHAGNLSTALASLQSFYRCSDDVAPHEFHDFCRSLLQQHPQLQALEWAPRVPEEHLPEFLAKWRGYWGADFTIRQCDDRGRPQAASRRAVYFPVALVEPLEGNANAIGLDLAAEPMRAAALRFALEHQTPGVTCPLPLVQTPEEKGALAFLPVPARWEEGSGAPQGEEVAGMVLVVVRVGTLLREACELLPGKDAIEFAVHDITDLHAKRLAARIGQGSPVRSWLYGPDDLQRSKRVDFGGRTWQLTAKANEAYVQSAASPLPWVVLVGGLGASALLFWVFQMISLRHREIARRVAEQTESLQQITCVLEQREQQYRSLVQHIPGVCYRCRCDENWTMEFMSDSVATLTGYSTREFIHNEVRSFASLIHPDDRDLVYQHVTAAVAAGVPWTIEYRVLHRSGEVRHVYERGEAVAPARGQSTQLHGFILDMTPRVRAENNLRRSEWLLQEMGRMAQVGSWELDVHTRRTRWSPQVKSILDVDEENESALHEALTKLCPSDRKKLEAAIEACIQQQTAFDLTLPITTRSGRPRWVRTLGHAVLCDGEVKYLRGAVQDVTTTKEVENRLELALSASSAGLWDYNFRTGEVYYSDEWYTLLGYAPGELPMEISTWKELTHPVDLAAAEQALRAYYAGRRKDYRCEVRMRTAGGDWKWIQTTGKVIEYDSEGKPLRSVGLHFDIDRLRRTQDQLDRARQDAEAANRTKSAFLANMSHEIRTPMTAILGYAEVAEQELQTLPIAADDPHREELLDALGTIRRNGGYLNHIINDILDLSKIEAGQLTLDRQRCDVATLVAEVAGLLDVRARAKNLPLHVDFLTPLPATIPTDPNRLKQVLVNVIGNAIKFTERGEVRVTVRFEQEVVHPILILEVLDTGIGMNQAQLARLFQPFQQGDDSICRRFGGTGLGLTISKRLTELLGGRLEVESELGHGSCFRLLLPLPVADSVVGVTGAQAFDYSSALPSPTHFGGVSLTGKRILLAEDGVDNQRLIQLLLRKAGAEVVLVEDGQQALHRIEEEQAAGRRFHVVLMDMQMPVLDGYQATRTLRATGYEGAVLALTANAMQGDCEQCLAAGCDAYLSKPINRTHLVATVARYAAETLLLPTGDDHCEPDQALAASP